MVPYHSQVDLYYKIREKFKSVRNIFRFINSTSLKFITLYIFTTNIDINFCPKIFIIYIETFIFSRVGKIWVEYMIKSSKVPDSLVFTKFNLCYIQGNKVRFLLQKKQTNLIHNYNSSFYSCNIKQSLYILFKKLCV